MNSSRALVVLAAYDSESLQLTLQSLEHTLDKEERVIVILNGKSTLSGERVERVARTWAAKNYQSRFVVRPLSVGSAPYVALTEIMREYAPLKDVQYICKIDDDLIPLKKGWLPQLSNAFQQLAANRSVGFVTGLINNNTWGFAELVRIFEKEEEYAHIMNYVSTAGHLSTKKVPAGIIDAGIYGTVWQYPYLSWWIHQWTSVNIAEFVNKTESLELKQIPDDVHYSIGCIFFEKDYWLSINAKAYGHEFDELLLHQHNLKMNKEKWALMNEPMLHLFYRTQRKANHDLIDLLQDSLSAHFSDEAFNRIARMQPADFALMAEEALKEIDTHTRYVHRKVGSLSIGKTWPAKIKKLFQK